MTITTRAPATRRNNPQDIQHPRLCAPLMPAHCQTPTSEDLMSDADDGPSPQPAVRALASGSP